MARKRYTPEQIIHLLRQAEVGLANGVPLKSLPALVAAFGGGCARLATNHLPPVIQA